MHSLVDKLNRDIALGKTLSLGRTFSSPANMTRPLHFTTRTQNSEVNGRLLHSEITCSSRVGIMPDPMEVKQSLPFPDSRFPKALHKRHLWTGLYSH